MCRPSCCPTPLTPRSSTYNLTRRALCFTLPGKWLGCGVDTVLDPKDSAISQRPPPISEAQFLDLATPDEEEIKRRCIGYVRSLHAYLNQLPCLSDLQRVRRRWKARTTSTDAFGTFATDPQHWYTFHHGGRNEAQFNVGLHTTHLRVGMGFEFSQKKGGDPTAVHLAYACFINLVRSDQHRFEQFVADNRLEIEWADANGGSLQFIPTGEIVRWLLNPPRMPIWIFVGRLLRRGQDSDVLENADALGGVMESVLCGFRTIWERTQVMAHLP